MMTHITDKTIKEEVSASTRTFNILRWIRERRLKWLGHILRMPDFRLVKLAIRVQHNRGNCGNLLMDIPGNYNFEALCRLAGNRKDIRAIQA